MKTWRLKKGADRRLRQGHPWAFASEMQSSTKEILPGELIELRDGMDRFLAYGYGHPSSQICFRKLSSNSKESDVFSEEFFVRRLRQAREHRLMSGWGKFSHRWLYAEADGVPGLIVDAFLSATQGWIVVVQASTAGADRALPQVFAALRTFEHELGLLTVIEAPSSKSRLLEGLKLEGKKRVFGAAENLEACVIMLCDGLKLECDLLNGQKTGFFLDQQWNAQLLNQALRAQFGGRGGRAGAGRAIFAVSDRTASVAPRSVERSDADDRGPASGLTAPGSTAPLKVLDICCYVGQWAAHAGKTLVALEREVEVTLVDVSQAALNLAEANVRQFTPHVNLLCADALDALGALPPNSFDVVICDPPAFVKKKTDTEAGSRAYVKLNRDALKLVKQGGLLVAASCSGQIKTADWQQILLEAGAKAGRSMRTVHQGGHAPDHPVMPSFPEGEYPKCTIARADFPF